MLELEAQGAHLWSAVEAQQFAPFSRRVIPQGLDRPEPAQRHEGQKQKDAGETVKASWQTKVSGRVPQQPADQGAPAAPAGRRLSECRAHSQSAEWPPPVAQGSPPAAPSLRSRRVPSARHNRSQPARSWCWAPTVVRRSVKAAHALRYSPPPDRKKPQRHSRLDWSPLARHRQGVFFNRRADPSLAHPLLNGVELQSQRVGDLCRSGATRKAFLDLTHHSLHQHRWTARHALSVESLRALLAVDLHRPLDTDRRHPKGADDVPLLDMAGDAELAGDHAKGGDVSLGLAEHRHVAVEIGDLAVLPPEGQLVRDVGDPIGENG